MKWITSGLLCGALALAGCAGNNNGPQMVNKDRADQIEAQRSGFDGPEQPINANTRFAAGQLAESRNALLPAIEQYRQALQLDPKHEAAVYRLAVVYTMIKEYPKAIQTWEDYVKLTKGSATAYSNLGFCREVSGHFDEAEAAYLKGIEKDAKNVACRTNYGLMLARHDKIDLAKVQLSVVLNPAEVHYNLGSIYEFRGMKSQARSEYKSALEIDKAMQDAQKRLAALE